MPLYGALSLTDAFTPAVACARLSSSFAPLKTAGGHNIIYRSKEMARRTGIPTLVGVARQMCRYITRYTPVIRTLYPDNTLLLAALATANEACDQLEQQLTLVREVGD